MLEPPADALAAGAATSNPVAPATADSPAVSRLRTNFPSHCDFTDVTRGSVPNHERTVAQPADRYCTVIMLEIDRAERRRPVAAVCAASPFGHATVTPQHGRATVALIDTASLLIDTASLLIGTASLLGDTQ